MKRALVCGAGGFIGNHMVSFLKKRGYYVCGVDLVSPIYNKSEADDFQVADLRSTHRCMGLMQEGFDEVFQMAADMGGALYIFTQKHDADIMHNSCMINLNMAHACVAMKFTGKIFFSSSACIYPQENQTDPDNPRCPEDSAYPAHPDSCYGWEKLFSENLWLAYHRNYGLDVRIARFHNIFGECGAWGNGKEKSPSATCRKVAQAPDGGTVEVWGPGTQTRSFLYIDECLEGIRRLMDSEDFRGPVNIGSDEMISINNLTKMVAEISGKNITIKNVEGPVGVMGRNSDNTLIREKLGWAPSLPLRQGMEKVYTWIDGMVKNGVADAK